MKLGFYEVKEPQYGDMLVCNVGRTEHPNHAVIWLGDQWQLKSEESNKLFWWTINPASSLWSKVCA